MPPTTSRDFLKAAGQRLTTAETLLRERLTVAAQYIGGYTVECSLKALILKKTPDGGQAGQAEADHLRRERCTARRCCLGNSDSEAYASPTKSPHG